MTKQTTDRIESVFHAEFAWPACAHAAERALKANPHVDRATIDYLGQRVRVAYDPASLSLVAEEARHAMLHAVPKLSAVTVHVDPANLGGHDHHAGVAHHQPAPYELAREQGPGY